MCIRDTEIHEIEFVGSKTLRKGISGGRWNRCRRRLRISRDLRMLAIGFQHFSAITSRKTGAHLIPNRTWRAWEWRVVRAGSPVGLDRVYFRRFLGKAYVPRVIRDLQ